MGAEEPTAGRTGASLRVGLGGTGHVGVGGLGDGLLADHLVLVTDLNGLGADLDGLVADHAVLDVGLGDGLAEVDLVDGSDGGGLVADGGVADGGVADDGVGGGGHVAGGSGGRAGESNGLKREREQQSFVVRKRVGDKGIETTLLECKTSTNFLLAKPLGI